MSHSSEDDELVTMHPSTTSFSTNSIVRPLALGVAALTMAVMVGCAGPDESTGNPPEPVTSSSSPTAAPTSPSATSSSPASPSAEPSSTDSNGAMIAAGRFAAKEVKDSTVVSIESEQDGWEVHVVTADGGEQQLRINPSGTELIAGPTDDRPDADDKAENKQFVGVDVDFAKAIEVTLDEISDGLINEIGLDTDNRRTVWEADVSIDSQQRTVQIDATTGKVLSNRVDD
ncbi:MAG: PepSY domain-containing protein [Microlunatus sp.]